VLAALCASVLMLAIAPSASAGEPAPQPKPVNTGAPKLTGTPARGQVLACSQGTWANSPTSYTYAWLRDGTAIASQSASTYTVQSADQGHSISCQVTASNSGGEYTISGLPSGSFRVSFFSEEEGGVAFQPQFYKGVPLEKEAAAVSVTVPGLTSGIDAVLAAGGQISGRVTAASGGAVLANVSACAYTETAGSLGDDCAQTNSAGEYTLAGLPSGHYEVNFYAFGGGNYLPVADKAVAVSAPGATTGIDAAMPSGGQITGKVTAEVGGAPLELIEVCESSESVEQTCTSTNAAGEYTVSQLESGEYELDFERAFSGGNYLSKTRTHVNVTAGAVTAGIDAALAPGGEIEGTVKAPGGAPAPEVQACVVNGNSCAFTNASGVYTLAGLAKGEYEVQFTGPEGKNYAPQYYQDKPSRTGAKLVSVTPPSAVTGIDAEMHTGAQIEGQVTAAAGGAGLAAVIVCAEAAAGSWFGCATSGAGGSYVISGLPGSTYKLSFDPNSSETFEFFESPNYLPLTEEGVAVAAEATHAGVNAALASAGQISGTVSAASTGAGVAKFEVCAHEIGGSVSRCALTNGGGGSVSSASNPLVVPAPDSDFSLAKAPVFDAKTGELEVFVRLANAGTLSWDLSFKNSDVGFADSLGIGGIGAGGEPALAIAETAKHGHCKRGSVKHRGRCVRELVPFAGGSKTVPAGTIEIKVRAGAKALKALKAGHTLHVSGPFKFQSALGGAPVVHTVSAVIHWPRKRHGHHH
jgi:hypothetical protein